MVTTIQKVIFPNSTHSVPHISILKFSIPSTFTKMVTQLNSILKKSTATITQYYVTF